MKDPLIDKETGYKIRPEVWIYQGTDRHGRMCGITPEQLEEHPDPIGWNAYIPKAIHDSVIEELVKERNRMKEALEFYEPIVRKFGCSPSGDHDDPTWCDATCNDYGKRARQALNPKVV